MAYRLGVAILCLLTACSRGRDRGDEGQGPDPEPGEPDAGGEVVTVCPDEVPAAESGVCTVTGGAPGAVFLRGTVLGPDEVFERGGVLIEDGAITCTGCDCAGAAETAGATRIDCAGGVISPGLINAHQHLTFEEGAPIDHGETRYDHRHEWRGELSAPQNPHGTGYTSTGNRWGELRMLVGGATSIVGSGRADGLVRNLDLPEPADEAAGIAPAVFQTFSLGDANEEFHADCDWSYRYEEGEAAGFHAFLPHVAEGIDDYAAEEFRCQSTSFDGGVDYTEKNASHIHSIGLDARGYFAMAKDGTRLIWSPRSNISLYGVTAQVQLFDRLGGVVALGTDWSYSGSANVPRELACADQYNRDHLDGYFSDRALWQMATTNAALATGTDAILGDLAVGKLGDVAVFAAAEGQTYRAVIEADSGDVALVLRGGVPLYGEAAAVAALDPGCEAIEVCGADRSICASREIGVSFAELVAEAEGAYPLFFCEAPADEPTCIPSRPGEFDGALTDDDGDGDGVADGDDACPSVFDPIRPLDRGAQADVDGDGVGDACDATPLGDDLDGDGTANADDNCPLADNADQGDEDGDGKGDGCDFCPADPNPDSVCPAAPPTAATIPALQMGAIPPDTTVAVTGAVVTGVWASGLWVQDPAGGPYSGIHVFTGAAPGAAIGDVVDVTGDLVEYFDDTQLEGATVTVTGPGTPIAPLPLTVAQAADEMYEGVLVTLTDAAGVVAPYSCAVDNPACMDADLFEIDETIVVWNRLYAGDDWVAHMADTTLSGVMSWRFDRRRLMPRSAADFSPR